MNKRLERARRRGEPVTRAWNPVIEVKPFTQIEVDGESYELVKVTPESTKRSKAFVDARAYRAGPLGIIASIDKTKHGHLMHLSVSHKDKLPSWSTMITVKRLFFHEDVAAMMPMPEEEVYVNVHEFCLHIWQLPEKWGLK